jgi:hypothetical protein
MAEEWRVIDSRYGVLGTVTQLKQFLAAVEFR